MLFLLLTLPLCERNIMVPIASRALKIMIEFSIGIP